MRESSLLSPLAEASRTYMWQILYDVPKSEFKDGCIQKLFKCLCCPCWCIMRQVPPQSESVCPAAVSTLSPQYCPLREASHFIANTHSPRLGPHTIGATELTWWVTFWDTTRCTGHRPNIASTIPASIRW